MNEKEPLTPAQQLYLERETILELIESFPSGTNDDLTLGQLVRDGKSRLELVQLYGFLAVEVDALQRAQNDLEEARKKIEEDAAHPHRASQLAFMYPSRSRREIAQMARKELADPGRRHELAVEAGLYRKLEYWR